MKSAPQLKEAVEAFQRGDLDQALEIADREVQSGSAPQWHHLLGLIHCRLGDPGRGVEHLRSAAQAEPHNLAFQVMLVRALVDAGRADEVMAMAEPPPIASPPGLALWQARAEAAGAAGDHAAAADAWAKVAAAGPKDWRAWGNLGKALVALSRLDEGANALVTAAMMAPHEPQVRADAVAALIQLGRQHRTFLRFDEAEAAIRRAYELGPTDASVVRQLGEALERTNRLDDLRALLADAASSGIGKDRPAYLWALLAWREGRLDDARELLDEPDPDGEPLAWHALRTKVADALGDIEAALEAATAMNRAVIEDSVRPGMLEEFVRRSDEYRQQQRELARTITPKWAAGIPVIAEPPPQRIAFLLGFPRSGTTLLDTFLLGHPMIEVLEEKQLVGAARQDAGSIEALPTISMDRLKQARETYFSALAEHVSPGFTGVTIDKFPLDMGAAPLIHALFPGAPILFAQRHPCDVVLSGFLQPFGTVNFSNIADAADYYDAMMSIWAASLEALPLNVQTIVYEELVEDPEPVLRPAVGFLGLEWDGRVLDHRRTAIGRGTIVTPSYDQVTEPVTNRAVGRWKRYREQLDPVLAVLLPWAQRLGYPD